MKLSMMVVITSWAPKRALSTPAAAPQAAPVPKAVATQSGTSSQAGRPAPAIPTQAVAKVAAISWPSAPMLKRPQRKARATARPVQMSGVA